MIKITVINDNLPGEVCGSQHGLCFLIEADIRFLFDTGPSDIILGNASKLRVSLDEIPLIVISHGHYDHTGGLPFLIGKQLICHPGALEPKYRKSDGSWNGIPLTASEIRDKFSVTETRDPLWLSPAVVFLGEIPRLNDFESISTAFMTSDGHDDFIPDDSGVAIVTRDGLVIISGCAHAGICNIVQHARKVTGTEKVYAVIGGFHLKEDNGVTRKTIQCLEQIKVRHVYPSHCTTMEARRAFADKWESPIISSGTVINLPPPLINQD